MNLESTRESEYTCYLQNIIYLSYSLVRSFEFLLGGAVLWVDVAVVTVVFSDIVYIYLFLQGFVEVFHDRGG